MYMDFKIQFYNELSSKKYIEILTTMQHYKMPTRLLDTTSNPLVP
jgi:beta-glucosidase/6-phospho-beta-glucosidase/beta-galactosidase